MSQVQVKLEKLEEVELEEKTKTTIQAIQQEIDESAKIMVAQNAEHQKQKEESEGKNVIVNPITTTAKGNGWIRAKTKNSRIYISTDGLSATNYTTGWRSVSAEKGFNISVDFSSAIIYYFEVTITIMTSSCSRIHVGLSSGNGSILSVSTNSYAIGNFYDYYRLTGNEHNFEWPNGAIKPESKSQGDVLGCGLLLNAENEVSIFFTGNGLLMGKQTPKLTMDTLYPTVFMDGSASVEANFGGDSAKPFQYDIKKCPGLVFK